MKFFNLLDLTNKSSDINRGVKAIHITTEMSMATLEIRFTLIDLPYLPSMRRHFNPSTTGNNIFILYDGTSSGDILNIPEAFVKSLAYIPENYDYDDIILEMSRVGRNDRVNSMRINVLDNMNAVDGVSPLLYAFDIKKVDDRYVLHLSNLDATEAKDSEFDRVTSINAVWESSISNMMPEHKELATPVPFHNTIAVAIYPDFSTYKKIMELGSAWGTKPTMRYTVNSVINNIIDMNNILTHTANTVVRDITGAVVYDNSILDISDTLINYDNYVVLDPIDIGVVHDYSLLKIIDKYLHTYGAKYHNLIKEDENAADDTTTETTDSGTVTDNTTEDTINENEDVTTGGGVASSSTEGSTVTDASNNIESDADDGGSTTPDNSTSETGTETSSDTSTTTTETTETDEVPAASTEDTNTII